mgnify:CR=1 FL=1
MLWSSSGFASWFGNVPSGSQYSFMTSRFGICSRSSGANGPATPFPASITTFRGFVKLAWSIFVRSSSLYSGQMFCWSRVPGGVVSRRLGVFGGPPGEPA